MKIPAAIRALVLGVVAIVGISCADLPPTGPTGSEGTEATWTPVAASPLTPRYGARAFWVDGRIVVVGGSASQPCPPTADCTYPDEPPLSDGASFDPAGGTWTPIADASVPIWWASGAVVDDTLYLWVPRIASWSGTRAAFLSYSPDSDQWEELPIPPIGDDLTYLLAESGHSVIAYQSTQENGIRPDLTFDVSARTWAELPPDPLAPSFDRTVVWTDAGLVLLGIEDVPQPGSEGPAVYRAAVLEASTGSWRRLPDSEISGYDPSWFWVDGTLVNPTLGTSDGGSNSWGRAYPHGGLFDPRTGTWSPLPEPPEPPDGFPFPEVAAAGDHYVSSFSGWALHVPSSRWIPLDPRPSPAHEQAMTWGDDRLFVWGGVRWDDDRPTLLGEGWLWTPPEESDSGIATRPEVARIVCEADGSTSVLTPEVVAQPDGVHVVVDNELDEPASLIGGLGFDVDPGTSAWTVQVGPGDRSVACWPFGDHGADETPALVPLHVLDTEGWFVPPAELACGRQWSEIRDFVDLSSGLADHPVEAVRDQANGLEPSDVLEIHRAGYPEADPGKEATVVVSRDGRPVVLASLTRADDGRWLVSGGSGCADVAINLG